ncbi:UDP-glucuronosyl/UDP-glucosyltransferase [Parasponia andersonii]|uniref:UDP-glucuronosyl/UDP-glucosyltransferase n=1 Tax=Parasponia andersonii TaxID=3476 RepID=A0A2P5CB31_PARAD|nr:UDP-glucuronosyl/UDP-glucosyltransferase [Parasponia andersonii]
MALVWQHATPHQALHVSQHPNLLLLHHIRRRSSSLLVSPQPASQLGLRMQSGSSRFRTRAPIPVSDIPPPTQDRTSEISKKFLETLIHVEKSSGVVVNTFELLESRALRAIRDRLCLPGKRILPVFPVGPVILTAENSDKEDENGYRLSWLSTQPTKRVFLSFGSLGLFSEKQLAEMAMALENRGHIFLWVKEKGKGVDEILPEGCIKRKRNRGLVVKRWAPQVAVLSHDSIGGFVTHCGWNSVLEAICAGVPIVALYAEQRLNRVLLVEEMKLAWPVNESEDGFVSSAELEKRVREREGSEGEG